ncbi:hypothetical protein HELRODRAFT_193840 [Helobdella robusta]|uniref:Uncharacterized protein n=1 Tax=Helobdella robusta TaxID=6412 RepID=T1FVE8_HELRO|nr:hypothetical protein HELRODRAFT_193840 [Helobdella robusta]ESN94117.1 hypothetical protein HELRODRAFT_193840 [Helobdella robusta]
MSDQTTGHLAVVHGHAGVLHTLLRAGCDINMLDKNQWSMVHCAAYHGRLGCLQLLVRWGGSVEEVDGMGNTAAHLAATSGHLSCLKFIMGEHKSKWNNCLKDRNNNGETALMLAHQYNKQHVVEYIKNLQWEVEHPEEAKSASFPAHLAAYTGDLEHLVMLIDNQVVHIDERDDNGATPAHKAAGQGHLDILQWLIEHDANTRIKNKAGESVVDVARRFAQLPALQMLQRNSRDAVNDEDDDDDGGGENGIPRSDYDDDDDDVDDFMVRAKNLLLEMEKKYEVAKMNFIQLGGVVDGVVEEKISDVENYRRQLTELKRQLDMERAERMEINERMEEYKDEIIRLTCELQQVMRDKEEMDEMMDRKTTKNDKTVKKKVASR